MLAFLFFTLTARREKTFGHQNLAKVYKRMQAFVLSKQGDQSFGKSAVISHKYPSLGTAPFYTMQFPLLHHSMFQPWHMFLCNDP